MSNTEKKFAEIISVLLHPVLMPLAGFLIIMYSGTYVGGMEADVKNFLIIIISGLTIVLPLIFIPLYLYIKLIRNVTMTNRRDRVVPFYITLVFYLIAFLLLRNLPLNNLYNNFMVGTCLTLLLIIIFSLFWKISIHMAGLGGIVALILYLSFRLDTDLMLYLVIAIFLSGAAAYARLATGAHTPLQVCAGFTLGLVTIASSLTV